MIDQLRRILDAVDGKGYKAYKELQGRRFTYPGFDLLFHYIQGDPFASPSRLAVRVPQKTAGFPAESYRPGIRGVALADYLTRKPEGGDSFGELQNRIPLPHSFDPYKGQKVKIKARGDYSRPRPLEVAAAINRLRTLAIRPESRSSTSQRERRH